MTTAAGAALFAFPVASAAQNAPNERTIRGTIQSLPTHDALVLQDDSG